MGLFDKSEAQLKRENDWTEVNRTIRYINQLLFNNNSKYAISNYINNYAEKVINGYDSAFGDLQTVLDIFTKMVEGNVDELDEFKEHFEALEVAYSRIVSKTDKEYKREKAIFIDTFIGNNGILRKGLYDESIEVLFDDKLQYLELLSILNSDDRFVENIDIIKKTLIEIAPEYSSGVKLKAEAIRFLDGFKQIVDNDYSGYSKTYTRRILKDDLPSEKERAEISRNCRDAQNVLTGIQRERGILDDKRVTISEEIDNGVTSLQRETENGISAIKGVYTTEEQRIINAFLTNMTRYLNDSKPVFLEKGKEAFAEVLKLQIEEFNKIKALYNDFNAAALQNINDLKSTLEELKESAKELKTKTEEITKNAEEKIDLLEERTEKDPKLQQILEDTRALLDKVGELEIKTEKIDLSKLPKKEELNTSNVESKPINYVPKIETPNIIIPIRDIELPSTVSPDILPFLNQDIDIGRRRDAMYKQIEKNEANGVRYHKRFKQAAVWLLEGKSIYLYGPSGSGKGYMIDQLAELFGYKKVLKLKKITDPYTVEGYIDPQGHYQPSPAVIAAIHGYLLAQNEFDNYDQNNVVMMNDLIDDVNKKNKNQKGKVEHVFCGVKAIDIHPNFHTIATGNTRGEGANIVYPQRGIIDGAVEQRLWPIFLEHDKDLEKYASKFNNWNEFIDVFRDACAELAYKKKVEEIRGELTTRDIFELRQSIDNNIEEVPWIIEGLFTKTKNPDDLKVLGKHVSTAFNLEEVKTLPNINNKDTPLCEVPSKEIAKTFVYYCNRFKKGA